eukprot:scaffold21600_cov27-Tisochrysis_lutea.AAC.1
MRRSLADERPDFVIRGRPDLRAACIPRPLETCGVPYLAMQDYLWGSDAFFYGARLTCASTARGALARLFGAPSRLPVSCPARRRRRRHDHDEHVRACRPLRGIHSAARIRLV